MKRHMKAITIALGLVVVLALVAWVFVSFRGSLLSLFVLACAVVCPLAMLFMMRGTQSRSDQPDERDRSATERKP